MGRWQPRQPRGKFIKEGADYCNGFVREAGILEYGPRPPRDKFIRESADYCNGFVREAKILVKASALDHTATNTSR
jgi:hypothetical protein